MHQRHTNSPNTRIVFTRWSRNPAAVFHSRRTVVNIGCLKANVLDQISQKCTTTLSARLGIDTLVEHSARQEDDPEVFPQGEVQIRPLTIAPQDYPPQPISHSHKNNITLDSAIIDGGVICRIN